MAYKFQPFKFIYIKLTSWDNILISFISSFTEFIW